MTSPDDLDVSRETSRSSGAGRCSKCRGRNDRAPQRYCSACHAAYQRGWRAENRLTAFERSVIRWLREHAR